MGWGRRGLVALTVVLLLGCTPSSPDEDDWRTAAGRAVDDAGSQVAAARLVLRGLDGDRLTDAYARVVLVESEEAAATAEEGLATLQPPPELEKRHEHLLTLLGDAADLVRETRMVVVAGDDPGDLPKRLDELGTKLEHESGRLP